MLPYEIYDPYECNFKIYLTSILVNIIYFVQLRRKKHKTVLSVVLHNIVQYTITNKVISQ